MNNKIFKWRFYNAIVSFCENNQKFCTSKIRPVLVIDYQGANALVLPITSKNKIHFLPLGLTYFGKIPNNSFIMNQINYIDKKCFIKLHNKILSTEKKKEIILFINSIMQKINNSLILN